MPTDRTEEGAAQYCPGGLHPVHLGDVFNGRYEVLRKIGYGQYSTVWLVQNQQTLEYRALKILRADCYGTAHDVFEREILERLRDADPEHLGHAYISQLTDSFEHRGPNGCHVCLVFHVMGETLSTFPLWFPDQRPPNEVIRRFTIQLLLALDYAHASGIIHTDIKPDNIFVKIKDESIISELYLPNNPADPSAFDASTDPATIQTQPLECHYFRDGADTTQFDVVLGDWGVASWTDRHLTEYIQPVTLRSPEVLIKAPWGPKTDLWNLGAVVFEVFLGVQMFRGRQLPGTPYEVRRHLHEIVDVFGPIPKSLLDRGDQALVQEIFNDVGEVRDLAPLNRPALSNAPFILDLGERNRSDFVGFLHALMKIDPEERKDVMELLAHPWLHAVVVRD